MISSPEDDAKLQQYTQQLNDLRVDGVNKVLSLQQDIATTKKSKLISAEDKQKLIANFNTQLEAARKVAAANKASEQQLAKEAVAYNNTISKEYKEKVIAQENKRLADLKAAYNQEVAKIKADAQAEINGLSSRYSGEELKEETSVKRYEMRSALFDAKSRYTSAVEKCKDTMNQAFITHVQKNRSLRNGRTNLAEDMSLNFRDYIYKFKLSKFFLDNGLYLAILVFFIVCIILAPLSGSGNLLTLPNIFTILEQSSVRMFYALGVAGLILLAGTDLSVGRMVAMGAVVTGLILHPGMNIVKFFDMGPWDFTALPMGVRVVMSLAISIALCVAFSSFAGFFTARFKIHPFISTLATQLIIYGLLFFGTSGTPVGSIDGGIKDALGGRWILGVLNGELITFPKLIIPAVIAIVVAWFIWNKTTFGKNMYAVGGNAEAASVSGISVFKVTMGVFIMAGIFYGCGGFLEAFKANASAGTGQGYELDAIAACVVGGISFNGGIGKIGGAVIGVIIFTGLTYCLTFLG
ncbi:MAG: galactoside ABC transporter permease, partial [Spirochaetaceae bacterium]|nr:galactoside ABC transporter permease [Spirochaetaceae bacterium]